MAGSSVAPRGCQTGAHARDPASTIQVAAAFPAPTARRTSPRRPGGPRPARPHRRLPGADGRGGRRRRRRQLGGPGAAAVLARLRRPDRRGVARRPRRRGHRPGPDHRPRARGRRSVERRRDARPDPTAQLGDVGGHLGAGHPARPWRVADVLRRRHRRGRRDLPVHRRRARDGGVRALHAGRQRPTRLPGRRRGAPRGRHPADPGARGAGAGARRHRPVVVHRQPWSALPRLPDPGSAVVDPAGEAVRSAAAGSSRARPRCC